MIENQITYLEVKHIFPHPQNPRKDLGDLSELTDSIKVDGIMQNLTVVRQPWSVNSLDPVNYTVIIGHRRLEAARLAGITEVPCVIAENMSEKKQLATMLVENIQRSELTPVEQAQGFQLMLDMGETANSIAKLTGFSKRTVKRRFQLLELDREKLKEAEGRGGTFDDYERLEKIEDIDERNKILEKIGTNNFEWDLKAAIGKQNKAKIKVKLIETAKEFAEELGDEENIMHVEAVWYGDDSVLKIPDDSDEVKYYYDVDDYRITIYKEADESEEDDEEEKPREKTEDEKRRDALKEISEQAYNLRFDFVKKFSQSKAKKNALTITKFALRDLLDAPYRHRGSMYDDIAEMMEFEAKENETIYDLINEAVARIPERAMLVTLYCSFGDSENRIYFEQWSSDHKDNTMLNNIYDFLAALGYEMSDEEKQLRDGTHELFEAIKNQDDEKNEEENEDEYDGAVKDFSGCEGCHFARPHCEKCCNICTDRCNGRQLCRKDDISKEDRECDNCGHIEKDTKDEPCISCNEFDKWVPQSDRKFKKEE
jgi:ParB family chromosome partitioning protein